jgi:hypothetical protein
LPAFVSYLLVDKSRRVAGGNPFNPSNPSGGRMGNRQKWAKAQQLQEHDPDFQKSAPGRRARTGDADRMKVMNV